MNREEAKLILSCIRSVERDGEDPDVAEALALLETDAELARWFEQEMTFDADMREALGTVAPPETLKAQILGGLDEDEDAADDDKVVDFAKLPERGGLPQRAGLAIAALLVIALILAVELTRGPETDTSGRELAVAAPPFIELLDRHYREEFSGWQFDVKGDDWSEYENFMKAKAVFSPGEKLKTVAADAPVGCLVINVEGKNVGMLCFRYEGKLYHLYTASLDEMGELAPEEGQYQSGDYTYATWSAGNRLFVLSGESGIEMVRKLL